MAKKKGQQGVEGGETKAEAAPHGTEAAPHEAKSVGSGSKDQAPEAGGQGPVDDGCAANAESVEIAEPGRNGGDGEAAGQARNDGDERAGEDDICPQGPDNAEPGVPHDKYLRLAAEYDNYRKRSAKEMQSIYANSRIGTISELLPVYDNLERALKTPCTDEAFYKGVEMIMTGLMEIFENMGVTPIKAVGETFDPNRHNAVMAIEDPGLGEKCIADEFQKGFIYGDRVIRFSNVVVAN